MCLIAPTKTVSLPQNRAKIKISTVVSDCKNMCPRSTKVGPFWTELTFALIVSKFINNMENIICKLYLHFYNRINTKPWTICYHPDIWKNIKVGQISNIKLYLCFAIFNKFKVAQANLRLWTIIFIRGMLFNSQKENIFKNIYINLDNKGNVEQVYNEIFSSSI